MKVQNGAAIIILVVCSLFFSGIVFAAVVKINWNSNTESDLAGYKVYCGTAPGSYSYILNVQYCKPIYVSGLQDGLTYSFAVSAYDWSGNESALSGDAQQAVPQNNPLDNLINLSLQPMELLYQLGTYDPLYSLTLENSLSGIRIEVPSGAAGRLLYMAISSAAPSSLTALEFDIAPNGFVLNKPAIISVPINCNGKRALGWQYDEGIGSWVKLNDISTSGNLAKFSTQKLGKFLIYPEGDDPLNPFSQQMSGESKGSSGGGGGGCFIETSWINTDGSCLSGTTIMTIAFTCFFIIIFISRKQNRFSRSI